MAQAEEFKDLGTNKNQKKHISSSNDFPRDFLLRFKPVSHKEVKEEEGEGEEEEQEIELSLGLSLNGKFGVDPIRDKNKLTRSSSIPDFLNPTRENGSAFLVPPVQSNNLARTCSLPIETEEEWRKKKEMQMLRRMEAKRKRLKKQQRNCQAAREWSREKSLFEEEGGKDNDFLVKNLVGLEGPFPPCLVALPSSKGSIGSQGSGSSGLSESESFKAQGMNSGAEARSPNSVHSRSEPEMKLNGLIITETLGSPIGVPTKNERSDESTSTRIAAKDIVKNVLEDMPYVSTAGDGPDGKRVEGFLYRYGKGEEVKIVCVCHGNFFSPAEFVKHAGGGDVTHPLKHIVVNPSPLL